MKKYIKASDNRVFINIVIEYEYYGDIVKGTETLPADKMDLTDQEQDNFEDFLINIDGLIYAFQFDVQEQHSSNRSNTSQYYAFYGADSEGEVNYEKLYFIRISTHQLPREDKYRFPQYYKDMAEKFKTPKSKKRQSYCVKKITVNKDSYATYEDAYDAIEKKFKNIQISCDKLNGNLK